ncbi:carboxylating nicotinate-nucleotide diphosphorylase [Pedobacter sp. BS3]|uniref:carboxylating nicotinate-nucleotide diphosphorylase n=1 Tax=Pedobacter sp. BS3 TaxID=2567937 RepID=UPI0011EDE354|nr:carboxylating nicotinate-nucleotide diphosphorylase [Pedobacter sp. BS3]TZF83733.1 carboxylating nicotinate-nucleotide diphosphorylase [Pedobacter sp. BS3]
MEDFKKLLHQFVQLALAEDVGPGDYTSLSTIPQGKQGTARLLIKEDGILAGVEVAREIFRQIDPQLHLDIFIEDGAAVKPGDVAFIIRGNLYAILIAERLVLNTMQRMSGIASITHRITQLIKDTGTRVLDTRKTTPNMRFLEKIAVKIGGGVNHRFGLYDMILIKDNHVDYAGGITAAISAAKKYVHENQLNIPVEIEVRSMQELQEVIEAGGVDRILLDNFDFDTLKKAVQLVNGRFVTEASGGITEDNVRDYALCGVDYVSMGALTHSVKSLDMSLKAVNN